MFCSKCGEKNEEGSGFCSKCGEKLGVASAPVENTAQVNNQSTVNSGGVRKAIKNEAKIKINGSFIGATAVYMVVAMALSYAFGSSSWIIFEKIDVLEILGNIVTTLVATVFGYGLISTGFKALRGNNITFSEIFVTPFNNLKEVGYVLLFVFIWFLAGVVFGALIAIPILGILAVIAFVIAMVYFAPVLTMYQMILADQDNKLDLGFVDLVKKAMDITKGHRVQYYGVVFSFIGWALLIIPTFGIILIWLLPYIQLTMINLYRQWSGEEPFTTNLTGLSDGAIIGVSLGSIGCLGVILVTIIFIVGAAIVSYLPSIFGSSNIDDIINGIQNGQIEEYYDYDAWDNFDSMNIYLK